MAERSRPWNGTTVGDAIEAAYDAPTEFSQILATLAGARHSLNQSGVFPSATELLVTAGIGLVNVGPGWGLVYGTWYENDSGLNLAVPTPSGAVRYDRVVIRKNWVTQQTRATLILGVEGGGAPPTVKLLGSVWDMNLFIININTSGVINVVADERNILPLAHAPAISLSRSTFLPVPTGGPGTTVTWDVVEYTTLPSMYSALTPTKILIQKSGLYAIAARLSFEWSIGLPTLGTDFRQIELVSAAQVLLIGGKAPDVGNSTYLDFYIEQLMTAGEYLEIVVEQDSGSTLTVPASAPAKVIQPRFTVRFIQPPNAGGV